MNKRSAIPSETERTILIEAGHRCAACGAPFPLEKAHIVPWSKQPSHNPEDLICLCANCHQRSHIENWGTKTLREYKKHPWIHRQNNALPEPESSPTITRLELTINMDVEDFDAYKEGMFKYAIAGLLKISPFNITIVSKKGD